VAKFVELSKTAIAHIAIVSGIGRIAVILLTSSWCLHKDIGNGTFGIGCYGEAWKPSPDGTCVAFEVDDLDDEISELQSKNVTFAMEATDTPLCRFAIICDPDGNKILIHKRKVL